MARKLSMTAYKGAVFERAFVLRDAHQKPVSITNVTPWFQLRDGNNILLDTRQTDLPTVTCTIGKRDDDDAIILQIADEVLNDIDTGSYKAGISLINEDETPKKLFEFTLRIREGVPR